ncbi:nostrin [Coregonus clupeaformis]|uniref:nostrin n=1 Tax=Coregonus clupeaformis TaxID=59861 RepID=UPI001E1C75DE|nr:nostrin [Coregonus clupeaformis]
MPDPVSNCTYNLLYQDLKRFYKNGEHFCKELMTVFQQRAELEISYAKGLQKFAGKLLKASKVMNDNSTYRAWCHVSDEMYSTADTHRALGSAFQEEAILEIRQVIEVHNKRKRPLDNVVEKTGKLVVTNWSEQIKIKKKLVGMTKDHEALFNFVEKNTLICTEKKLTEGTMMNRLTKSAEAQTRADEKYFNINMDGHQIRLKWENTLKNCYQIIQELEKQRIEVLCNILNEYNLHMASFGQTFVHSQKQREQAIQRVDLEKDIQRLVEETSVTAEDNKAEFLMADNFEEDSKSLMEIDRRRDAIKSRLQRLEDSITKTKTKTVMDCEHSIIQLAHPVKIRKTTFRSRLRSSIIYKGPSQSVTSAEAPVKANHVLTAVIQDRATLSWSCSVDGAMAKTDDEEGDTDTHVQNWEMQSTFRFHRQRR